MLRGWKGRYPAEDSPGPASACGGAQGCKTRSPALGFAGCSHVLDTIQGRGEHSVCSILQSNPSDLLVMDV